MEWAEGTAAYDSFFLRKKIFIYVTDGGHME